MFAHTIRGPVSDGQYKVTETRIIRWRLFLVADIIVRRQLCKSSKVNYVALPCFLSPSRARFY